MLCSSLLIGLAILVDAIFASHTVQHRGERDSYTSVKKLYFYQHNVIVVLGFRVLSVLKGKAQSHAAYNCMIICISLEVPYFLYNSIPSQ